MIRISLRAKPEKFRFTTSFKRCYAVTTSTSEDILIQILLKQSANNNKPLSCDSTAIVRSAVLKLLARKEYNTVTRAIEMQYEVRNSTTLFRPALHCYDSLHAGMIAYGKLRKPNKSRKLVQRFLVQNDGLSLTPGTGTSTSTSISNNTSTLTSLPSLSSTQMTASFLLQAYCDADRLDLAEELFLQWLLLSRGNSDNASSSNGSGDSTIALTSKSSISSTNDVSLDAIIQYLMSYRKVMTASTSTTNPTSANGITTASFVPSPTAKPSTSTVIGDSGKETFGISNNNNSSSNNNQYPSTIDMSTLLSSSSSSISSHNNIIQNDVPSVIWLSLLRLYADRGNILIPLNRTY